jgi:hypothetical protein
MALCEQCGSISIVRAQSTTGDKLAVLLTRKRPFLCLRCGWRARRRWSDIDLESLRSYGAGGAEPDASLSVLDDDRACDPERAVRLERGPRTIDLSTNHDLEVLDLGALDQIDPLTTQFCDERQDTQARPSRRLMKDRPPSLRPEIITAIVVILVIISALAIAITSSCDSLGI